MDHYDLDGFMDMYDDPYGRRREAQPTKRNNDPKDFAHKCIGDDKNTKLPSCHYTDERFRDAQTVFGRRKKRGGYDYSDRYPQWDGKKWDDGHTLARIESEKEGCEWAVGSVRYYEVVLTHFHGKPTEIDHVLIGFNWATGYDYSVFGYYHPRAKKS